ncbi:hypothetical protein AGR6A_Cc140034 [Agrobacterium sp. NCPPB 925]|nr:hypothetical protein AGR6A_Cc140034 [Agrobacterium sp. NCPPB 925]
MGSEAELRMSQFVANAEADVAVCAAANDRRCLDEGMLPQPRKWCRAGRFDRGFGHGIA